MKLQSFRALKIHVLVIFQSMSDLPLEVGRKIWAFKCEELWKYSSSDKLHSSICVSFLEEVMSLRDYLELCEQYYDGLLFWR